LAFSYWIDNLGFITVGKLAAIFIKPSLGVSNWPVIYFINYKPTSSLAPFITAPSTTFSHVNYAPAKRQANIKCFNCSRDGHYQSGYQLPVHCSRCDEDGHTTDM
jgi:hypothetical protein